MNLIETQRFQACASASYTSRDLASFKMLKIDQASEFRTTTQSQPEMKISISIQTTHWTGGMERGQLPKIGTKDWLERSFLAKREITLVLKKSEFSQSDKKIEETIRSYFLEIFSHTTFYHVQVLHADVSVEKEFCSFSAPEETLSFIPFIPEKGEEEEALPDLILEDEEKKA